MNPTAIYSKSGKGVQEAAGNTSVLKRADRVVLAAIDGRATLAQVAEKLGKPFDAAFEQLIAQLDKDGFVREISAGTGPATAAPSKAAPAASKPTAKATPSAESTSSGGDLDFSSFSTPSKPSTKPAAPAAKPAAPGAAAQQSALNKAREEAEARAERERNRLKAEAEAKIKAELEAQLRGAAGKGQKAAASDTQRAEAEAKLRAETEAKLRAEAEAKIKAARDAAVHAAAQAKAKADAESKRVREEAEKARREAEELKQRLEAEHKAREEAERKAREEAERARKEAAEAERKAREETERVRKEAEQKAKEEAERVRRELEEERRKLEEARKAEEERRKREEEERKRREEEERKAEEERLARRKREEEEEQARLKKLEEERKRREEEERKADEERIARRKQREEEERKAEEERAARRKREEEEEKARLKAREEEEARYRKEQEERHKREEEEARRHAEEQRKADEERRAEDARRADEARRAEDARKAEEAAKPQEQPKPAAPAKTADITDSLLGDLDNFGKQEEEEQKAREEAERKAKADAERRAREEAERHAREEKERQAREEAEHRARAEREREEREESERRAREAEQARQREEDERKRKAQETAAAAAAAAAASSAASRAGAKPAQPAGEEDISISDADLNLDEVKREQQVLAKAAKAKPREEPEYVEPPPVAPRKRVKWGKPAAMVLILLLVVGAVALHVMPVSTADYERAASEAFGQPVKIGSARLWVVTGPQVRMQNVTIGNAKISSATGHVPLGTLTGERKNFSRIELNGVAVPQEAVGEVLFMKARGDRFSVAHISARKLELPGALVLPKELEAEIALDPQGAVSTVNLRGADGFTAKIAVKEAAAEFEIAAGGFTLPVAPEVTLSNFGAKGSATRQGATVAEWDGQTLGGSLSGSANLRWERNWTVDGVVTARRINAAVLAPTLLSEGTGDGTAKFTMSGAEPAKLAAGGRYEGNFNISRGVLGSFDLSRVIQTGGREAAGRTPFNEMNGRATYDRGAVALREVTIAAGTLNAGASLDIAQDGALSGRIVADVRTASTALRATLNVGGTLKEPRVRN